MGSRPESRPAARLSREAHAAEISAKVDKPRRRVGFRKGADLDEELWPTETFGGVTDEQFWDDLASDKPLTTTARTAQPGPATARLAKPKPAATRGPKPEAPGRTCRQAGACGRTCRPAGGRDQEPVARHRAPHGSAGQARCGLRFLPQTHPRRLPRPADYAGPAGRTHRDPADPRGHPVRPQDEPAGNGLPARSGPSQATEQLRGGSADQRGFRAAAERSGRRPVGPPGAG